MKHLVHVFFQTDQIYTIVKQRYLLSSFSFSSAALICSCCFRMFNSCFSSLLKELFLLRLTKPGVDELLAESPRPPSWPPVLLMRMFEAECPLRKGRTGFSLVLSTRRPRFSSTAGRPPTNRLLEEVRTSQSCRTKRKRGREVF